MVAGVVPIRGTPAWLNRFHLANIGYGNIALDELVAPRQSA
jgi:hypothetical protein